MTRKHHFLGLCLLLLFPISKTQAVTLVSGQIDYTTTSNIIIATHGISSTLSGTSTSLNKIKNLHIITTGSDGSISGAYGIRSTGNYNQITNAAEIFTTGSSGRGISIANNSIIINSGNVNTQGSSSYGLYAGGNNNAVNNSGSVITNNSSTAYGIYLSGNNNQATNSGNITTKVYGIYSDGEANQINNLSMITTSVSTSAHGIYISTGSGSAASANSYSTATNSGTINSAGNGIYTKDNFTSIINSGNITSASLASIYGIRTEGVNSTITNSGTVSALNYAIYNSGDNSIINNSGTLNGGVRIGNATLNILGGNINGVVEGSSLGNVNIGSNANPSVNFNQTADFNDLNDLTIKNGSTLNSNANINANRILIDDNSILNLNDGSLSITTLQGLRTVSGTVNFNNVTFNAINGIGISSNSLANLNINSNSSIISSSDIFAANIFLAGNLEFSSSDNFIIFGNLSGGGSGVFNVGSQHPRITGNFSLNAGDTLAVTLGNNGAGSVIVDGSTSIDPNAKLAITVATNQSYMPSGKYNIINSHSISNSVSDNNISVNNHNSNIYGLLKFTTSNTGSGLVLNIDRLAAEQVISSRNAQNIYQNLSNIGSNSSGKLLEFQQYLDASGLSGDEMTEALNQIAPQSVKSTLASVNNAVGNSILVTQNRLAGLHHQSLQNSANYAYYSHLSLQNFSPQSFRFSPQSFQLSPRRMPGSHATTAISVATELRTLDETPAYAVVTSRGIGVISGNVGVINEAKEVTKNGVWIQGFGGSITQKKVEEDDGYKLASQGIVVGADKELFLDTTIGLALSLARSEVKNSDNRKKNTIDTYQANLYSSKNFDHYFIDAIGGLAYNIFNSNRAITVINTNALARYSGKSYFLNLNNGWVNKFKSGFTITPEASLNFLRNEISGYSEEHAQELNLKVNSMSADFLEGRLGVNFGYSGDFFKITNSAKLAANIKISYGHFFLNDVPAATASFDGQKSNFTISTTHVDQNSIKLATELNLYCKGDTSFFAQYQLEHKATADSHFVALRVRQEF